MGGWGSGANRPCGTCMSITGAGKPSLPTRCGPGGKEMKVSTDNPLRSKAWAMQQASGCGARTRSGKPCQSPAMPNGRCRMHGGPSPGAPKGNRNAWKHGARSAGAREAAAFVRAVARLVCEDEA